VVAPTASVSLFGLPASELVDQVVPLGEIWPMSEVDTLTNVRALSRTMTRRIARAGGPTGIALGATRAIGDCEGRVSIADMACGYGLTRQGFARRFVEGAGLSPKLYARITRFQHLVHALLLTDVERWSAVSLDIGYYDQAHMINEFRSFAGCSPRLFFQPRGEHASHIKLDIRGRPSEWLQRRDVSPD